MENIEKSSKFRFDSSVDYSEHAIVSKTFIKNPSANITLFAFDKSQSLSEHTAPFDALVQIIEGEAEITINSKSHQLQAGESIIMPANIPHAVFAVEKFKMLLTMIKENN